MPLFFTTAATFVAILVAVTILFSNLFPGSSSVDFKSNEAYWKHFMEKQLLCRELSLLAALAAGLATGLMQCAWNNTSAVPLLLGLGTVELVWLLLMFVVLPPKEQTYSNLPRFLLALAAGAAVGIFTCSTMAVALTPLLVGGGLFLLAKLLLTAL